jgi:predicted transcriptional regulator of viral defense system
MDMVKNISYRSAVLLDTLNRGDKQFFTLNDAMNILSDSKPDTVRKLLSDMVKRGLLFRMKGGLYNVIPYEKDSNIYFPNWHLAAEALVKNVNYYIGFYSALDIHGLITQPSLIEQVITERQVHPKHQEINKVKFEFITFPPKLFFGYNKTWINDFNRINCSDIEKTIIDCLYLPGYANGISEILKAVYAGRNKLDPGKMLSYLEKYESTPVYKRLGFILMHLNLMPEFVNSIRQYTGKSYTLLDSSLPKKGKYNSEWKIIDNADIQSILNSIST